MDDIVWRGSLDIVDGDVEADGGARPAESMEEIDWHDLAFGLVV